MKFKKYETSLGLVRWKFYHYLGLDENTGKAIEVKRQGFKTKQEARDALMKIITQCEDDLLFEIQNKDKYRFEEVVDLWLMHYKNQVKITTFTTAKSLLKNHILPRLKDSIYAR